MEIKLTETILIFLTSCLIGIESTLEEFQIHRPIITCTLIGLILNNITKGIIIGSILEMTSLGWMNIGASISPDISIASIISTILVICGKQNIGSSIALAIPLSALGQILTILIRGINIFFQHTADKIAKKYNISYISYIHISALILQSLRVALPVLIISSTIKTQIIQKILNSIPIVITNGLNIAGGIIVVVGYAMVINIMKTKYLMPFFYLGFTISAFTTFNLVSMGIIGFILSTLYIQLSPKYIDIKNLNINNNNKQDELD